MKIAFLAGASSIHTIKWVNAMAARGHEVHLITMHSPYESLQTKVTLHHLRWGPPWGYYLNYHQVRRLLKYINPDLLNTHYASGYGTLARLSGFHPNLLSVWGSDVYDFPYESAWKAKILAKNLSAADRVASTSRCMKKQAEKFFSPSKPVAVTPFGVDTNLFRPQPERDDNFITIGMVKRMAPKYGPKFLIKAFASLVKDYSNIRLILVGGGSQEEELKYLTRTLGLIEKITFVGPVLHNDVPKWLNKLDIYCAPSTLDSESFGVAVLEASACGVPVVVSNVGGLPEVVQDGKTGLIVPSKDTKALSNALRRLIEDKNLRNRLGNEGRKFVIKNYNWEKCVDIMEALYLEVAKKSNRRGYIYEGSNYHRCPPAVHQGSRGIPYFTGKTR